MQITQSSFGGRNVVFDHISEDIPGGVSLDKTRLKTGTTYLKAGTLVNVVKSTRVAEIVKTATIITGGTSSAIRVSVNHQFKAGEYVTDGYVVQTISSITTGTAYDTLNLGGALQVYSAGTVIVEANASAVIGGFAKGVLEGASGHTLTITDPTGVSAGLRLVLARAGDDNLAVAYANGTLTITLANSTASKNTAALIQAAIRALITGAAYNFGSFVCVGASWSEDGSTLTTAAATMAVNNPYPYLLTGFIKDEVNVEYDNVDISVVTGGAVRESALPFPVTTAMKALLPKVTFNV